jgi:magnesium chelatase subunit D
VRAGIAYAALGEDDSVQPHHIETVLPLVLAHRVRETKSFPPPPQQPPAAKHTASDSEPQNTMERIFAPLQMNTPLLQTALHESSMRGAGASASTGNHGPAIRSRRTESPVELDVRATLNHAVLQTGTAAPRLSDLHERVRKPVTGTRFLFVIDSSGSHAAQERMRLVKGATLSLLARSFRKDDEVAIIAFRGTAAQVVLEPSRTPEDAARALEYLPTGGRTPLAHALDLAGNYLTSSTVLILMTDGRANVGLHTEDPWQDALQAASQMKTSALVIDTENGAQRLGHSRRLAEALGARYIALEDLESGHEAILALSRPANVIL